jgi:hypothetical protein
MSYFVKKNLMLGIFAISVIANCSASELPVLVEETDYASQLGAKAEVVEGVVENVVAKNLLEADEGDVDIVDELGAQEDAILQELEPAELSELPELSEQDLQQALEQAQQVVCIINDPEGIATLVEGIRQTVQDIFGEFSARQSEIIREIEVLWNSFATPQAAQYYQAPYGNPYGNPYANPYGNPYGNPYVNSYVGNYYPYGSY